MSTPAPLSTRRPRQTRRGVRVGDAVARVVVTCAGLGTVAAIAMVCLYLVWVVVPLFGTGKIEAGADGVLPGDSAIHLEVDEYRIVTAALHADSSVVVFRLDTGETIETLRLFERAPTCWAFTPRGGHAIFGFDDGTIRLAELSFRTDFLEIQDVPTELRTMREGDIATLGDGVLELTRLRQYRRQTLHVELKDPIEVGGGAAIRLVDLSMLSTGPVFASLSDDRVLRINAVREIHNIMTQQTTYVPTGGEIRDIEPGRGDPPAFLSLEGRGESALLVWSDGHAARFDTRDRTRRGMPRHWI